MRKIFATKGSKSMALVFVISLVLVGGKGWAQEADETAPDSVPESSTTEPLSRVEGVWPAELKPVTLDLNGGTLGEALSLTAKQSGLDLILKDPLGAAEEKLTLQLAERPAKEVVELLVEMGELEATISGNLLVVKSIPVPPPASVEKDPEIQSDPERGAQIDIGSGGIHIKVDKGNKREDRKKKWKHHHGNERVVFGESLRIEAGEEVDQAVAVGGSLTVAGRVLEDAVAVGGDLTLEPGSTVEGNAVSVGGKVDVQPGATLKGDRVGVGGPFGDIVGKIAGRMADRGMSLGGIFAIHTIGKFFKIALLFVFALLIVTFAPKRYVRVREYMGRRPGRSALAGGIMLAAMLPITLLLLVTVIGIPFIPIAWLALGVFTVFGLTAFLTWLGDKIPFPKNKKSPVGALAVGVVLLFLVYAVPFVGPAVITCLAFFGAGAAFLTKLGSVPKVPIPEPEQTLSP